MNDTPVPYTITPEGLAEVDRLDSLDLVACPADCIPMTTPDVPPTSPASMEMLRESHAAVLNHAFELGQRYLKGEATAEEVTGPESEAEAGQ